MNICFDALSLYQLQGTGLYSYSYSLIDSLIKSYHQGNYHLLWDMSPHIKTWDTVTQLSYFPIKVNRITNDFSSLEDYIKKNNIHVYHSPNNGFSFPYNKVCPYIMTVHDLITVNNEKYSDERYAEKFFSLFPYALKKTDKIIAVSEFVKSELLKYFKVDEDKVEVIYPIIGTDMPVDMKICSKNILKYKYNIDCPFILYVGGLHPRKNLRSLIVNFKEIKSLEPNLKLVIVGQNKGKRSAYYEDLISLCTKLNIMDSVIFTGVVHQRDIYYFYSQCLCLINLSEYEGFPFTLAEAVLTGTPAIYSNIPSNLEVAGYTGIVVNQRDPGEIKDSLLNMVKNPELRNQISVRMQSREVSFKGDDSVNKIIKLYEGFI